MGMDEVKIALHGELTDPENSVNLTPLVSDYRVWQSS
jgi:hypothetical protein